MLSYYGLFHTKGGRGLMGIYVTGDLHGDFSRFEPGRFPVLDTLSKRDYVIVCGDFGGVWDGSAREQRRLDWLEARPFTTLFVDGNHENFDLLSAFPSTAWHGGRARLIRPSVIHLMRGQVFSINKKRFFTMGGARSHDIRDGILEPGEPGFEQRCFDLERRRALYRVNHVSWWKEELPCEAEYKDAYDNLEKAGWEVDYIVTHCAPTSVHEAVAGEAGNVLTGFLEEVARRCRHEAWFFGHYHDNQAAGARFLLLYDAIVPLEE